MVERERERERERDRKKGKLLHRNVVNISVKYAIFVPLLA